MEPLLISLILGFGIAGWFKSGKLEQPGNEGKTE
jgi:hypothetical protein